MPLPKFTSPMIDVIIPSTNKKTKIRPMLVKEEKILLIAKEAKRSPGYSRRDARPPGNRQLLLPSGSVGALREPIPWVFPQH